MGRERFPGRSQGGRGHGRGPGRGRQNGRSGGTTHASKKEYKFAIQVHGSTTAYATYTSVKEALIRHIQSTYKNGFEVAESLENMQLNQSNNFLQRRMQTRTRSSRKDST